MGSKYTQTADLIPYGSGGKVVPFKVTANHQHQRHNPFFTPDTEEEVEVEVPDGNTNVV